MKLPNQRNRQLSVFQVLQSASFRKARQPSKLAVPLGMGMSGNMEILDLAKASPLLIAGSVTNFPGFFREMVHFVNY